MTTPPMLKFTPTGEDPAPMRAAFARGRANEACLEREWDRLLAEHLKEWAAAYGEGIVVTAPDMRSIIAAIPPAELRTAAVRYIVPYVPLAL